MAKLKNSASVLIYAACFCGLLLQVSQTEVPEKDLLFPAITLCVDFWTNKEVLCEMMNQNCTKQAMRIFYVLFQQNVNAELRNKTAFNSTDLFSCSLKGEGSCLSTGELDCSPWMRLSAYRRPLQMCYTLDVMMEKSVTSQCSEPWLLELHIASHITRKQTMIFMKGDLIPVIALEPQTSPLAEMANLDLRPGYRHIVTMKQQLIKRLTAPFESNCVNYKAFGYRPIVSGFHSMESCLQECLIEYEIQMCGCLTYNHEFIGNLPEHPVCLNYERGFEYCREAILTTAEYKGCLDKCGGPCRELRYDMRLASIAPMAGIDSRDRMMQFEVSFRFSSSNVEQLEYSPLLTFVAVAAYVGGSFGVWIGISSVDIAIWILHKILNLPFITQFSSQNNKA